MNKLLDNLLKHNMIFKKIDKIDLKKLNSRKKLNCYLCIDLKNFYHILIDTTQKSRFILKNVDETELLYEKLKIYSGINITKKLIKIENDLCQKAKIKLKELKWKII